MIDEINTLVRLFKDNDEFFNDIAVICRKAVDALVKEGFTRDEAIKITASSLGKK